MTTGQRGDPAGEACDVAPDRVGHESAAVLQVQRARQRLAQLGGQPVAAHIETYDGVHAVLADALAELDEA